MQPKLPPSRVSQAQIICYVDEKLRNEVLRVAHKDKKNIQEVLSDSVNHSCQFLGVDEIFPAGHTRLVGRKHVLAQQKQTQSRAGKFAVGGWFDKKHVNDLKAEAKKHSITMQKMLEYSLRGYLYKLDLSLVFNRSDNNEEI